jgi:RNA polymerase sigma factor (sigma-70 family)
MPIPGELLLAAQAGDSAALTQLLADLQPDIRRYARRQCHRSSMIEDVVQEALIVIYRRVGNIRTPAALAGWIFTMVTRLCMLPVLGLMRGVEDLSTIDESRYLSTVSTHELRIDMVRAIEALPPKYREIIVLRDLEELTISEVAQQLDITREATKSRLHRARQLLREYLINEGARQ